MSTGGQRDDSCCALSHPPAFASWRAGTSALEVQSRAFKVEGDAQKARQAQASAMTHDN